MPLALKELVRRVAKATRLRNHEARVVVECMLSELIEVLRRGEKVELRGLGTFEALRVTGRRGRDWKTGQTVALPPTRRVVFRPGRSLKPKPLPPKEVDRKGQVLLFGTAKTGTTRRSIRREAGEKP